MSLIMYIFLKFHLVYVRVPQASILGPFFFLININYIDKCIEDSQLAMFADHMSVIKAEQQVDNLITKDFDCMFNWLCSN